jgi:hypothetical protein
LSSNDLDQGTPVRHQDFVAPSATGCLFPESNLLSLLPPKIGCDNLLGIKN